MLKLTFTVKKWLSDEEFKLLLQIADYLGRDSRLGSKFRLNIDKIRLHNLSIEEVIEILEDVGIELSPREIKELEDSMNITKTTVKVTIKRIGSEVALIPHTYLGSLIEEVRPFMRYDKEKRIFIFKPYHFFEIIEELKSKGVEIINETNFKEKIPLPLKPKLKVELRPYQREALQAWLARGGRGVIALPTGSGKTIIGLAAISKLSERTLIVTYTKEQMFQWSDFIARMTDLSKEFIGLYYGEEKRIAPITISTYQTAFRYVERLAPHFSLLIVDEVHHLPADKFRHIAIHMPTRKRMGLSATVIREDGKHEELFPLMGGVVYYKFADELIAQGYLAPYKVITVFVKLNKNERKKYLELIKRYKELAKDRPFEEILKAARYGDPIAIEALKIRTALRMLVHNASSKKEAVKRIV
ncbi:MAG: ATP-dependent helicase, partial [Thermoprotei archaeon]